MAGTLAEKLWQSHVVRRAEGEPDLLYIDLHLVHEVTSPQAFDGLRMAGRPVRRRPRQPGRRHQLAEPDRRAGRGREHGHRLVQHADSAKLSHATGY